MVAPWLSVEAFGQKPGWLHSQAAVGCAWGGLGGRVRDGCPLECKGCVECGGLWAETRLATQPGGSRLCLMRAGGKGERWLPLGMQGMR